MSSNQLTDRLGWWLLTTILGILIAALLIADAPHLHDFAEWLYQAQILIELLVHPENAPGLALVDYPVPNALATALLAVLCSLLPAVWAGKLFLALMLVAWCIVIRLFVRRYFDRHVQGRAALILFTTAALGPFFWYGFIGYQLGLLLLTWYFSIGTAQNRTCVIVAFSLAIFFAHAMIFLVFALLIGVRAMLDRNPRAIFALMPGAVLSLWYLWGSRISNVLPTLPDAQWMGIREALLYKAGFPAMLGPFRNFLGPTGRSLFEEQSWIYWLGFVTNLFVAGLLGLMVLTTLWSNRKVLAETPGVSPVTAYVGTLVLLCAAYLVAPYNFFGLINPGGRLLLPIVLLTLLIGSPQLASLMRMLVWPMAAFTLLSSLSYLHLMVATMGTDVRAADIPDRSSLPRNSVFEFNAALYANTRFDYFNFRVFAFADRFERMETGDYSALAFQTGLIVHSLHPRD